MISLILTTLMLAPGAATVSGTVRSSVGKPIAGARVTVPNVVSVTTSADGRYSLTIPVAGDNVIVRSFAVSANGFVPFEEYFFWRDWKLTTNSSATRDFVLATGPTIAGRVDLPLSVMDQLRKMSREQRAFNLEVRGPSFKAIYRTDPGGAFTLTVPSAGAYSVTVLDRPFVSAEDVIAGSKGVVLAARDPPVEIAKLEAAFDAFADDFSRNYSYFELKKIDWPSLRSRGRANAIAAGSEYAFAEALAEMLTGCRDGHVWVERGGERIPTLIQDWTPNFNRAATLAALGSQIKCGEFAVAGRTLDSGFGALVMMRQSSADRGSVRQAINLFGRMRGAPGYLIDLRNANGGDESLARDIAELFCEKDTVYAKSRFRSGPGLGDFGPTLDRSLKGHDDALTQPLVVLIGPGAVSSGEGFVKMLKALPQATLVGLPTRGSSGNPRPFRLPGLDITVWYSRWIDLLPDGTPVEGRGIAPQVLVNEPPAAYKDRDPTLEKAIEVLKEKTKH